MKKLLLLLISPICLATEMAGIQELKYKDEVKDNGVITWEVSTFYENDGYFSLHCVDMRPARNLCSQIEKRECTDEELFLAGMYLPTPIDMPHEADITTVELSANGYESYYITDAGHNGNHSFYFSKKSVYHYNEILDMLSNADSVSVKMSYNHYNSIPDKIDDNSNYKIESLTYSFSTSELRDAFEDFETSCSM